MDKKEKVIEIMSTVFDCEINESSDVSVNSIENWDSLNHLELIVTLEQEFNIKIPHSIAIELKTLDSIVEAINKLTK